MKKLMNFYKRLSFLQGAAFATAFTSVIGLAANSIPGFFTFTSGSVISSSQINSNFDKLANLIENNQSQVFMGTWNATTNIPDIFAAPPATGGYYVVTVAGTQNSVAYNIGDWAIWNGTGYSKIQNTSGVASVFGRVGAVLKAKGDYSLNDLADLDLIVPPNAGQVLTYDGTKWLAGSLPAITENDPTVSNFAKMALPSCPAGQFLKSSGTTLICIQLFTPSPDKIMVTNASGELITASTSVSQLNYLNGVTSDIQAQLSAKLSAASYVDWSAAGVPTIDPSRLMFGSINRVLMTSPTGTATASTITTTELGYLSGVTSSIQTQISGIQSQLASKLGTTVTNPTLATDAANKSYVDSVTLYTKASTQTFTGLGYTATAYQNTGINNSFIGVNAGQSNTTGTYNTYVGHESGKSTVDGTYNTVLGAQAMVTGSLKSFNTAIGAKALYSATSGSANTALGSNALFAATTGYNNTAIGKGAGSALMTASSNIFVGYSAGSQLTNGDNNIMIGSNTGSTTGSNNIFIGNNVASTLNGSNNILIGGYLSGLSSLSDSIVISSAGVTPIERMRIDANGNMGIATSAPTEKLSVGGNISAIGTVSGTSFVTTSDKRLKKHISTIDNALEKILSLRGVEFDWIKDGSHEIGLIAQEVEAIIPDLVVTNKNGFKAVKYSNVVPLLIESTRETDAKIAALESENKMLKGYLCAKDPSAPFCE